MIWVLLVVFQFKHFIADYPLQGKYMLGKFKESGWVAPLTAHCLVHFVFTSVISFVALLSAAVTSGSIQILNDVERVKMYVVLLFFSVLFGVIDFTIHFIMDRVKASPKMLGRYEALSKGDYKRLAHRESVGNIAAGLNNFSQEEFDIYSKKAFRSNTLFWWSLGVDQMVHHLTDILIVFLIMAVVS